MSDITPAALRRLKEDGFRLVQEFHGPRASGKTTSATALCGKLEAEGQETRRFTLVEHGEGYDVVYARKRKGQAS